MTSKRRGPALHTSGQSNASLRSAGRSQRGSRRWPARGRPVEHVLLAEQSHFAAALAFAQLRDGRGFNAHSPGIHAAACQPGK